MQPHQRPGRKVDDLAVGERDRPLPGEDHERLVLLHVRDGAGVISQMPTSTSPIDVIVRSAVRGLPLTMSSGSRS